MKKFLASVLFLPLAVIGADTNALPPLAPAAPEIPPSFWDQHKMAVIIGAIIFLALAILAVWKIVRPKSAPVLPPGKVARDMLARLQSLPEDGKLLSETSQILRRHVGAVFDFPGGEMTTTEFSVALAANASVGPQLADALSSFLRACDKDKFVAKNEAPLLNAVRRALQLVEQIERRRAELNAQRTTLR